MKRRVLKTILPVFVFTICCMVGVSAYAAGTTIADADVQLSKTVYTYNGVAKEPKVTVVDSVTNAELVEDTDYTVAYSHNKNAGTATVAVTGKGAYSGVVNKTFTIKPKNINSSKVKVDIKNVTVGKSFAHPVYYRGKKLYLNKSYTVSSVKNSKIGYKKGYIVIKGIGNFTGKKRVEFSVHPARVTGVKRTARDFSSVTISWNSQKDKGVTGYKVYLSDKSGTHRKAYADVKDNECAIVDMKSGETVYIIVRSYKVSEGKRVYSQDSKVYATCSTPSKAVASGALNQKGMKAVNLVIKEQECTGYQVQYSTSSDFKTAVKTVEKTGKNKTRVRIALNANNKYYFRTRAFVRFDNGNTVYGAWSKATTNKFTHVYSSYVTYYSTSDYNRCKNLKTACKYISGTVLLPGETFSFNEVVGPRTKKKGFREAGIFKNGGHGTAVGGGICQVSTTLFNAALTGNLKINMRRQHSQRVAYIPAGRDAAMYKKKKDLRFTNNTDHVMVIRMSASDGRLTAKLVTCSNVKHKKVSVKVTQSKGKYVLRRYVDGKCNYKTTSKY